MKKTITVGLLIIVVLATLGFWFRDTLFPKAAIDTNDKTSEQQKNTIEPDGTKQLATTSNKTSGINLNALALGDGHISTSPKAGLVFSCQQNFRRAGILHTSEWIDEGNKTWDVTKKLAVLGEVFWSNASFSLMDGAITRTIIGNGLPVEYPTGIFPIQKYDPAYLIDRNPNVIKAQTVTYTLPINPTLAAQPTCLPMGAIGVALNGVAIYNALDAAGADSVAREVQDECNGHPEGDGEYHYHGPSACIDNAVEANALIGYALDGFGIYSQFDTDGNRYSNADLDECHGTTSPVVWNGKVQNVYHYVLTDEYPYTLGCFKGNRSYKNR